jgi:hypothetical protein
MGLKIAIRSWFSLLIWLLSAATTGILLICHRRLDNCVDVHGFRSLAQIINIIMPKQKDKESDDTHTCNLDLCFWIICTKL